MLDNLWYNACGVRFIFTKKQNRSKRIIAPDYKQQIIIKQGAKQLKALAKKGLGIPVALL